MHDLLINVTGENEFSKTVHLLIDYLLEVPKNDATKTKLSSLLNIPSGGDDLTFTLKLVENLLRQFCLNEINDTELKSHFSNLSPSMQGTLLETVGQRKAEVCQFLINEINAKDNLLMESFDWDVKWIIGNSSIASEREQIATMALNCRGNDLKLKTVRFEMNRKRLDEFIQLLEQSNGCNVDK